MAAGNGMRLRPITDDFQKCLLPVDGKPMLEWWLDAAFESECFDKVYVNLHHMAEQVEEWLSFYSKKKHRKVFRIDERRRLLGTAGTLLHKADVFSDFMIAYTDTFCWDVFTRLPRIMAKWDRLSKYYSAGLVTFDPPGDRSTGNMLVGEDGVVREFSEKKSDSGVAWAGIMFAGKGFIGKIRNDDVDLAGDVLPRMSGEMVVVHHAEAYDIGRGVEHYERFQRDFKKPGV